MPAFEIPDESVNLDTVLLSEVEANHTAAAAEKLTRIQAGELEMRERLERIALAFAQAERDASRPAADTH